MSTPYGYLRAGADVATSAARRRPGRASPTCAGSPRRARPTPTCSRRPPRARPRASCSSPTTRPRAGAGSAGRGPRRRARRCWCRSCCGPGSSRPTPSWSPLAAAVAACRGAAARSPAVVPRLKWPNDLVSWRGERFVGRKLAGILAESVVADGRIAAVVLGIGLNVNWPEALPAELAEHRRRPQPRGRPPGRPGGPAGRVAAPPRRLARPDRDARGPRPAAAPRSARRRPPSGARSGSSCPTARIEGTARRRHRRGPPAGAARRRRRRRSRSRVGDVVHLRHAG